MEWDYVSGIAGVYGFIYYMEYIETQLPAEGGDQDPKGAFKQQEWSAGSSSLKVENLHRALLSRINEQSSASIPTTNT